MTELLAKYFSENISDSDRKRVLDWRNENEQNTEEFFEYASLWNSKEFAQNSKQEDSQKIFDSIFSESENLESSTASVTPFDFRKLMRYAAVILLVAIGSYSFYTKSDFINKVEVTSKSGQLKTIILPDNSKVYLSENSTMSYPKNFEGNTREVFLDGKAFFEVTRDEKRTFIVRTDESEVKVLGTSFMVDSHIEEHVTQVVVTTGKVAVGSFAENNLASNILELKPGEVAKITDSGNTPIKYRNQNQNYLAWKTRVMKFDRNELEYVIRILQETYNIQIDASKSDIGNCRLTAIYDNQSIDSIMEILGETFSLQVSKNGNANYVLSGGGC